MAPGDFSIMFRVLAELFEETAAEAGQKYDPEGSGPMLLPLIQREGSEVKLIAMRVRDVVALASSGEPPNLEKIPFVSLPVETP